jgi:hypothetical protein
VVRSAKVSTYVGRNRNSWIETGLQKLAYPRIRESQAGCVVTDEDTPMLRITVVDGKHKRLEFDAATICWMTSHIAPYVDDRRPYQRLSGAIRRACVHRW